MRRTTCEGYSDRWGAPSLFWRELNDRVEEKRHRDRRELARWALALAAMALLAIVAAVTVPSLSYLPLHNPSTGAFAPESPEHAIAALLEQTPALPARGTPVALRGEQLVWAKAPHEANAISRRRIVRYTIDRVYAWSSGSVLRSVLSRSPTCNALVDVTIETDDGQRTNLTVGLWQYRLLLPGARSLDGNGAWMPQSTTWN